MANGAAPVANAAAGQAAPNAQQVIDAAAAQLILDQAAAAQLILDQAAAAAAAAALLPPPVVIVQRDWDTLVAEASIEPHTIAHLLLQATNATPWDETMIPFTRFLSLTNNPAYQADAGQWSYADDLGKHYFLTVMENKWEVITGYRRCTPSHANGSRLSGLRGDRRMIRGMITPPGLYTRFGALNVQSDLFMPIDAPALATADVLVAVAADPTANWMDPDVGANAANIRAWPMLPIHPKIASLFLQGRSLMAGFHLGQEILSLIPVAFTNERELWERQLRMGITRTAAGTDTSVLMKAWERKDPYDTLALTDWYFALLAATEPILSFTTGLPPAPSQGLLPASSQGLLPASGLLPALSTLGLPPASASPDPTTEATLDLLMTMTERLAGTSVSTGRSQSRSYDWVETEYLLERVGAPRVNGSFTGLGVESLPEFFQQLITVRGEKSNARMHLERYRINHLAKNMTEYGFVWSTQLLKDLKGLSFSGDDVSTEYINRFRGLSVFSLAPVSESNMSDAAALRQTMVQFESTEHNHGPIEAAAMAKLTATWNTVPGTRQEAHAWVEHVGAMTIMMFGATCPANPPLAQLRTNLLRPGIFVGWTESNWKAFIWALHVAYRAFMQDVAVHPLSCLSSDIEARKRPDPALLPDALLRPAAVLAMPNDSPANAGAGRKRQADINNNHGPPRHQGPNAAPGDLSAHLRSMLAIAKPKTSKHLIVKDLFPDYATTDRILGAEFLALVIPPGQHPCLRHHIYGNCSTQRCSRGHQLRAKPSPQLLDAIAGRVQTQLDSIIRQYPN
jgi:hypothetical protein